MAWHGHDSTYVLPELNVCITYTLPSRLKLNRALTFSYSSYLSFMPNASLWNIQLASLTHILFYFAN